MELINEIETFLGYEQSYQRKKIICILTGQFSSGKTKFVNYLSSENLLPVGTREMTAVPTYIHKGRNKVEVFKENGESKEIDYSTLYSIKKGACEYSRIDVSVESINIPDNLLFVDTPGVNSLSFECNDGLFNDADVILYFLAKSISAVDVETIERLYSHENQKLIFVRTRIDEIKKSEEDIFETFTEEQMLLRSIYPESTLYFVSLTDENAEHNQITELLDYLNNYLEEEILKIRSDKKASYISKDLCPSLEKIRAEILASVDDTSYSTGLLKKSKKQLKTIEKNLKANEDSIRQQIMDAKYNYLRNGNCFIEKRIDKNDSVSCREIQSYVLICIRKLEDWYMLELEDVASDMMIDVNNGKFQRLISEGVLTQVFAKYERVRNRFLNSSIILDNGQSEFADSKEANEYLRKLLNSVFLNIDGSFSENYENQIEQVLREVKEQYSREDGLIQQYATPNLDSIEKIDQYLLRLRNYEEEQED